MLQPIGVILAGGQSRRMNGENKAHMAFRGKDLLSHVHERLVDQVDHVVISAGPKVTPQSYRWPMVYDETSHHNGPLAGILSGLSYAKEKGATHIVSAACDTPFIPCDLAAQLLLASEVSQSLCSIAYTESGAHPVCGLWHVSLIPALKQALDHQDLRLSHFSKAHHAGQAYFHDERDFININTQKELSQAEKL